MIICICPNGPRPHARIPGVSPCANPARNSGRVKRIVTMRGLTPSTPSITMSRLCIYTALIYYRKGNGGFGASGSFSS